MTSFGFLDPVVINCGNKNYIAIVILYLLNFEERRKPAKCVHTETGERQITSSIRGDGEERR